MSPRSRLALIWIAAAVSLSGGLAASQQSYGGLDDANLAYERPGLLDLQGPPIAAPMIAGIPARGRRAVIFFTRPERVAGLERAASRDGPLRAEADLLIVAPTAGVPGFGGIAVVADGGRGLAAKLEMRTPRDGGFPVGYAVVDSSGRVRYPTLDPELTDHLDEVETMVRATP